MEKIDIEAIRERLITRMSGFFMTTAQIDAWDSGQMSTDIASLLSAIDERDVEIERLRGILAVREKPNGDGMTETTLKQRLSVDMAYAPRLANAIDDWAKIADGVPLAAYIPPEVIKSYMNASETLRSLVHEYRCDRSLAKDVSQEEPNDGTD